MHPPIFWPVIWSGNGQDFPNLVRNSCINRFGAGSGIGNQRLVKPCNYIGLRNFRDFGLFGT